MTRRARNGALFLAMAVLVVAVFVAATRPVPYVRFSPGPVYNALGDVQGQPVVTVSGATTFPTDGALDITTVFERGAPGSRLTLVGAVAGWIQPGVDVVPRDFLYSEDDFQNDDAGDDARRQGAAQLAESEQNAIVAALQYVGKPVQYEVVVSEVDPDAPAIGVLEKDDAILAVNGVAVSKYGELRKEMDKVEPGESVQLTIRRDDKRSTLTVDTIANPDDPERAYIGVFLGLGFTSPVDVTLRLDDVGGPSAGLIFSLAIVDTLTPGALVDGRTVAGTGTITPQGKVGIIGGIVQKMYGARDNGASMFLAPRGNCRDIKGNIPDDLTVVSIRTLDDAVAALNGSGPLTSCPGS